MLHSDVARQWADYWIDRWQRVVLTLDILRERGDNYLEAQSQEAPHVLDFEFELVCSGRTLDRPVNYVLVHIIPPVGARIDPTKAPFVVVDPRAGHGPGIGGMKQSSEIGVAMAAGHPCYFIGFLPEPEPEQTIEDVCQAQAEFIARVAERHPNAEGKPVVIANCQAGWQTMITAALHPDLAGPILLAGSPLSYWAGARGGAPMRYLGGLFGGTWMTALAGDLGDGKFDGAHLIANFESLNLANTLWTKPYNLFAKVDTEKERFLDFETWWGAPVLLNAVEMQWIADNLFLGNKLSSGALRTSAGVRIDLRNIRSPIVVFCSWGDDITPPPQALGWITDLYEHESEIAASGQTIVYAVHQSIGHLGIFVSGKVASKEHAEFASCMSMVELAPPGLYEAVIVEASSDGAHADLIEGDYLFRLEPRTLDDIRCKVGGSTADERCFAAVARIAETNLALYRTLGAPWTRLTTTPITAAALRRLHPNRLRFTALSRRNPLMQFIAALSPVVREHRRMLASENSVLALEGLAAAMITSGLEALGDLRDAMAENLFFHTYGSSIVQAAAGLGPEAGDTRRRIERDLAREADQAQIRSVMQDRFIAGGAFEACIRALLYLRRPEGGADERLFNRLRALRSAQPVERRRTLAELKSIVKDQSLLLSLDEDRALQAIPQLLPLDADERRSIFGALRTVAETPGPLSPEGDRRLGQLEELFTHQNGLAATSRGLHSGLPTVRHAAFSLR